MNADRGQALVLKQAEAREAGRAASMRIVCDGTFGIRSRYFDAHGEPVAPNGIELHPALGFSKASCR